MGFPQTITVINPFTANQVNGIIRLNWGIDTTTEYYLYNEGVEHVDNALSTHAGGGTFTRQSDHLRLTMSVSGTSGISIYFDNKINFANFSKVWVDWELLGTATTFSGQVSLVETPPSSGIIGETLIVTGPFSRVETSRDISSSAHNKEGYVRIALGASGTTGTVTLNIYKVWLEE